MRCVALLVAGVALLAGCSGPPTSDAAAPDPLPDAQSRPAAASPDFEPATTAPLAPAPAAGLPPVPDPNAAGSLPWERWTFELDPRVVDGAADVSPYVVIPEGSVHAPKTGGPFPIVLLMHGRHGTCGVAGVQEVLGVPCPEAQPVVGPVDSFAGYDDLAENLASHGYVVASLSANHVNDRDNDYGVAGDDYGASARARLALTFLDDLRDVEAGGGPEPLQALAGRLDLGRIGLMGHSRGGEGVVRAAVMNGDWPEPHALKAVFALAPTDFDRHKVAGLPLAVLLPYCDGDVSTLHGAWMYDDAHTLADAGPLYQVVALGANHNWYNTVWTRSDWTNRGDPHCDLDDPKSGRDSMETQLAHGVAVMASFLRVHVGGESDLAPLLTGEVPFPHDGIVVTHQPPSGFRLDLDLGRPDGFTERDACTAPDCPIVRTYGTARQTYLEWEAPATLTHPIAVTDASRFERVGLRVAFDHEADGSGESDVVATLVDAEGRSADVPLRGGVFHPPGETGAKATLNLAWAPLDAFAGVDVSRLVELRFTFLGSGAAQVADVQFHDLR